MYMEHDHGGVHQAWKVNIAENKVCRTKTGTAVSSGSYNAYSTASSDKQQLKLSDKIQASMITSVKFSRYDMDRLMTAYNSGF